MFGALGPALDGSLGRPAADIFFPEPHAIARFGVQNESDMRPIVDRGLLDLEQICDFFFCK